MQKVAYSQNVALISTHALIGILLPSCALCRLRLPIFKVFQLNTMLIATVN